MQKKAFDRGMTGLLVLLVMAAGLLCPSGNPAGAAATAPQAVTGEVSIQEFTLRVSVYEREDRNDPPLVVEGIMRLRIDPETGNFTGEIIPTGDPTATIPVDGQIQGRAFYAVLRDVLGQGDVFALGTTDRGPGGEGPIVRARGLALGPKFFYRGVWEGGGA
jgi:hypothetical protein